MSRTGPSVLAAAASRVLASPESHLSASRGFLCTDRLEVLAVKGVGWDRSRLWGRGGGHRAEKPPSMRRACKTSWEGLQQRGGEGSGWRSPGLGLEGPRCPELLGPGSAERCHPLTLSRARLAHDGVSGSDASCPGCFRSQRRSFWRKRSQSCLRREAAGAQVWGRGHNQESTGQCRERHCPGLEGSRALESVRAGQHSGGLRGAKPGLS